MGSKLKFYKSLVLPRLMCGAAESWALIEAQGAQLETFHGACPRQVLGLHCACPRQVLGLHCSLHR